MEVEEKEYPVKDNVFVLPLIEQSVQGVYSKVTSPLLPEVLFFALTVIK